MEINRRITPVVIAAATNLLQPYCPDLNPRNLIAALKSWEIQPARCETPQFKKPLTRFEVAELLGVSLPRKNIMKTLTAVEHVKLKPQMYCPDPGNSNIVFEMALRFFIDSHIAGCTNCLFIDYKNNEVRFRDFGKPLPFDVMREAYFSFFQRCEGDIRGMSGWTFQIPITVMGLCNGLYLTSFCQGKKIVSRSHENAHCREEENTEEGDGVEIDFTHPKSFDSSYIYAIVRQYHALYPELRIWINGKELPKSNGLIDLLYQKINPLRILEPLFSYQSEDLDLTAALQMYPKKSGGPFIMSYLNCYDTYEGKDHIDAVKQLLKDLKYPFRIEDLCIVFHYKMKPALAKTSARQESCESFPIPDLYFSSTLHSYASFSSVSARENFIKRFKDALLYGKKQYILSHKGDL